MPRARTASAQPPSSAAFAPNSAPAQTTADGCTRATKLALHEHVGAEVRLVLQKPLLGRESAVRHEERTRAAGLQHQHERLIVGGRARPAGRREEHAQLRAGGKLHAVAALHDPLAPAAPGELGMEVAPAGGAVAHRGVEERGGTEIIERGDGSADVLRVAVGED